MIGKASNYIIKLYTNVHVRQWENILFYLVFFFLPFENHKLHLLAWTFFFRGILKNTRQKHDSRLIDVVTV